MVIFKRKMVKYGKKRWVARKYKGALIKSRKGFRHIFRQIRVKML